MAGLRSATRVLAAGALLLVFSEDARPAGLGIRPTQLSLPASGASGTVVLENQGSEPLRVQVSVARWTHTLAGELVLGPTEELVAYPTLSIVPAGGVLRVRVGPLKRVARTTESSFRLLIEELPPPASGRETHGVTLRTRLNVPVFLAPTTKPVGRVRLDPPRVDGTQVTATLVNIGNTHLRYERVRIRGYDKNGLVRFDEDRQGWYVLAGETRLFEVPVPAAACRDLASVSVEVPVARTVLKERLHTAQCGA